MQPGKVIIVGGSVGGLFAGVLLKRAGWQIEIHERSRSGLSGKGAGLVPQHEVASVLREIGREDVLRTAVVATERIFLDRDGEVLGMLQTPQAQMSWDLLFQAWMDEISPKEYHLNHGVRSIDSTLQQATVHFEDGSSQSADLVLGADGISSSVREFVAPETHPHFAGYAAFRGLVPEQQLAPKSAEVVSDRFTFFEEQGLQYLGYTVAGQNGSIVHGERRYNWVWYRRLSEESYSHTLGQRNSEKHLYSIARGMLPEEAKSELYAAARAQLPSVLSEIITQDPLPFLQGIFDYETPVMYRARVSLLGDAAFVVRPHTAMGVAKAAADALELRNALTQETSIENALQRYNLHRMEAGKAIAQYGRRLGQSLE
ncbi:MAG: hypothetical protein PW735_13040 [Acidobacteriaceae bacterium]|nr:hypothetical protein [Acidobacteriaceae bacterium]